MIKLYFNQKVQNHLEKYLLLNANKNWHENRFGLALKYFEGIDLNKVDQATIYKNINTSS